MNVVKEIERINQKELENGIYGGCGKGSWHDKYKDSAWVYVGGLSYELSEGDIVCVMSQWGEIEDINLVREKGTNTSKGFAFVKYEDQRSTILAVDNFNGIKLLGRILRVDHVDRYKLPKEVREREEERLEEDPEASVKIGPGHAYTDKELANEFTVTKGLDLWAPPGGRDSGRENVLDQTYGAGENERGGKKKHKESKEHKHKRKHKDKDKDSDRDRGRDRGRNRDRDKGRERSRERVKGHHQDNPSDRKRKERVHDTEEDGFSGRTMPRQDHDDDPRRSSAVPLSALPPDLADAPAASWRGRRDPTLTSAAEDYARRLKRAEKEGGAADGSAGGPSNRRDEFAGFGGMNRRR